MTTKAPALAGRTLLAVLLMFGFYALALGIAGGIGALIWIDVNESRHVHGRLIVFGAITIGIILWSVMPRPVKFPDPGVRLTAKEQPELLREVDRIAKAAGQSPPAEVYLVPDVNAFVAERGSVLGFGGRRVLGIGLPLLQLLSLPQLRSVLAHEFGHFHGGDTRLGPFLYRTRAAIGRTIANFQKTESLLQLPFRWYGNLFLRVTFAISRQQEFAADALSVQLVGLEPVQTALRRVNETAPLYDHYLQSEFLPMLNGKVRPPLAQGFGRFLQSKGVQQLTVHFGEQAMQAKSDPYDTHPPLSQRLSAAARVDRPGRERAAGPPAIDLLRDVDRLEAELIAFLVQDRSVMKLPARDWDRAAAEVLPQRWAATVREHAARLPQLSVAELAGAKDRLGEFASSIDPRIPAKERVAAGIWLFGTLLAHRLVQSGYQVVTQPGDPISLQRGDCRIDPFERLHALAEGTLTREEWQSLCADHGIGDLPLAGPVAVGATGEPG